MTYAAPAVSYGAPAMTYAAPTTYAAPMTYGAPVAEVDKVDVFGRVVERDFIGGGMTYAAPAVPYNPGVSFAQVNAAPRLGCELPPIAIQEERSSMSGGGPVSREAMARSGRLSSQEVVVQQPVTYAAPGFAAPMTYAAPGFAAPMTYGAPMAEVDRVDALGRVVERDFIGGGMTYAAPAVSYGAPAVNYGAPTTYAAPRTYGAPVAEVDRVDAFGRVVERDFIGGGVTYA